MQAPQAPTPPASPSFLAPVAAFVTALLTKLKVPAKYQVYVQHVVLTFAGTFVTLVVEGSTRAHSWSSVRDLVSSAVAAAGVAAGHYIFGLFKKS